MRQKYILQKKIKYRNAIKSSKTAILSRLMFFLNIVLGPDYSNRQRHEF